MKGLSMEASIEEEELDASVAYVASLLAEEPPNIKLVVGCFSMGAATSLYCAICFAHGRFGENVKLDAVVACSGWFPITKLLDSEIKGIEASLPICLFHVKGQLVLGTLYPDSHLHLQLVGFIHLLAFPKLQLRNLNSSLPSLKCPKAVKVGDKVHKGQVVRMIEPIKSMEIEADQSGTITGILAEDGKPVGLIVLCSSLSLRSWK